MSQTVSYSNSATNIDWSEVATLFQAVGWGQRDPKEIKLAFEQSSCVRFAYIAEKLVGFGRTVDDGIYYAMIADLVIDPNFQNRGIGSAILEDIQKSMQGYQFLTLTAAVGQEQFYIKQNWHKQSSAFIWPVSDKQRKEHAKDDI